jgi:hypothetical protein
VGIFDRFRKSKPTAAPTPSATAPEVPARATIATFVIADAVGMLELDSGEQLRFGRSACKGFEPVVGTKVLVEEVASDPRGWKARVVTLDSSDTGYDTLLSARDTEHGLPDRTKSEAEAAATARQLGIITVLLREPLPSGNQAVRAWAAARGFPRDGFDAKVERDLELAMPSGSVLTYAGRAAFPRDGLDLRNVGEHFDLGSSFIGLGIGLPGGERQQRAILANTRDCWALDGRLRQISRLVCMLADAATGVVLHRAADLVMPVDEFVRLLGDLDDPECRPFAAWLDLGITRRDDKPRYATWGMDVFGLPDVFAAVDADDRWSRSRRHEAVLYACYRMIRENREFKVGETLTVPVRLSIGAWPLDVGDDGATTTYAVADLDGNLELVAKHEASGDLEVAVNLYQAKFDHGLDELVPSYIVRDVPSRSRQPLEHNVEVRARDDGRGFLVVTNGFGAKAGFEVAAWVPRESLELVQLVGTLAGAALEAPVAWKPGDTLAAPVEDFAIGGFIIADGGTVTMARAPGVRIFLLIPLAEADYTRVRGGGAAAWLASNELTERVWTPFLVSASR